MCVRKDLENYKPGKKIDKGIYLLPQRSTWF